MKKYLLGLLAIPFGLIAFSNAETINVSCQYTDEEDIICNPSQIEINNNNCVNGIPQFSLSNFSCNPIEEDIDDYTCGLSFENQDSSHFYLLYENGQLIESSCAINGNQTTYYVNSANLQMAFQGNINNLISNNGGGNEGGNEGGNGSDLGLISHLTPAITGLWDTVVELIPYIVYIGIGVLLFTLGFYAIRRLVNWIGGKINSNFKSKR